MCDIIETTSYLLCGAVVGILFSSGDGKVQPCLWLNSTTGQGILDSKVTRKHASVVVAFEREIIYTLNCNTVTVCMEIPYSARWTYQVVHKARPAQESGNARNGPQWPCLNNLDHTEALARSAERRDCPGAQTTLRTCA